ncbi:tRNA 2-thiouridine(34) synthase MnmA [Kiritimatiella glycovorans]|uniref:tRNA-specific 2-thiouridylase MnmA n=1 Tax=Kiritimatiella glycovorans TaxID=1307763 RepID=A0A0G3ELB8_9BACT|nr:tRNA 2-thiouridine(34) synthase MnmA [Kiritimatiella glycovorans]AKJ64924.1 tRNA-specific 2-thiouridylase MnmA [Kiritimatiella glycovorans]
MSNPRHTIAIGLSGGTDSAVAAALLLDEGREVLGLTARFVDPPGGGGDDARRAEEICEHLGIRHVTVDARERFRTSVILPFAREYASGRTPSPCIVCNETMKFGFLMDAAAEHGCGLLATGHYARLEDRKGEVRLLRGADSHKDQSYFLHRIDRPRLPKIRFPLGAWHKEDVKAEARRRRLPVRPSRESQDLCFTDHVSRGALVASLHPDLTGEGLVRDETGAVIGKHGGYHLYTLGQRTGIGVATGERRHVAHIDPAKNEITLAPRSHLLHSSCTVRALNWLVDPPAEGTLRCRVQPRYRHRGGFAQVKYAGGEAEVRFDEPQFALTPGQAAVFYDGDRVLGGGWIAAYRSDLPA